MDDVRRLLKRNPHIDLAELPAQPVVHDVVHHPQRRLGDPGRELADFNSVKLVHIYHRKLTRSQIDIPARVYFLENLDFENTQFPIGNDQEVAATAGRIEECQTAELRLELLERREAPPADRERTLTRS